MPLKTPQTQDFAVLSAKTTTMSTLRSKWDLPQVINKCNLLVNNIYSQVRDILKV